MRRSLNGNESDSGNRVSMSRLRLRQIVKVGIGSLILFVANTRGHADGIRLQVATEKPLALVVNTEQPQVQSGERNGDLGSDDVNFAFEEGFADSIPEAIKHLDVLAAPTPPAEQPKTSLITFKVKALNCLPWSWCRAAPWLHFVATENMKGYHVTYVTLSIADHQKRYDGGDVILPLPLTTGKGAWIQYWAVSDHKEGQSPIFRLKYRYVKSGGRYRFELLGVQWAHKSPSGSLTWGLFPPLEKPLPEVLMQPRSAAELRTTNRYVYLAGSLLRGGVVYASNCPDGGLYPSGTATPCGEEATAEKVLEWQNKYNQKIFAAAVKYNVPARVLKGILAQESQFWPHSNDPYERGLGMFTEDGADMALMWNTDFFLENCIPMYGEDTCASGYSLLHPVARQTMRKSLIDKIGTSAEINLLAATLYASAAQVNQMTFNTSYKEPSDLTDYETMWKISTGNYYAGSGCIGMALDRISAFNLNLTWEQVIGEMDPSCQLASRYVDRIFSTAFDSNLCSQFSALEACH
jgi:hypothetical protein